MSSPFPGMDPYLEGPIWHSFHTTFCVEIARQLNSRLDPSYVALPEEWLASEPLDEVTIASKSIRPDVSVVREAKAHYGVGTMEPPIKMAAPLEVINKVRYIEIRRSGSLEVVTIIELLSRANKRGSSRNKYLTKRRQILASTIHLIEIDLLRGGERVPMEQPYPHDPYFVLVHREQQRPMADVWPIALHNRLPIIPVPLAHDDADVELDLQSAFESAFEGGRFKRVLDYSSPPSDAFTNEESKWIEEVLVKAGVRG